MRGGHVTLAAGMQESVSEKIISAANRKYRATAFVA
jgi:hypothetical protein